MKSMYKTEVYSQGDGYVACAVNRSNDFVLASTKPCHTSEEAMSVLVSEEKRFAGTPIE